MKLVTLEKVLDVLKNDKNKVVVDEELREASMLPLKKMLELAK